MKFERGKTKEIFRQWPEKAFLRRPSLNKPQDDEEPALQATGQGEQRESGPGAQNARCPQKTRGPMWLGQSACVLAQWGLRLAAGQGCSSPNQPISAGSSKQHVGKSPHHGS